MFRQLTYNCAATARYGWRLLSTRNWMGRESTEAAHAAWPSYGQAADLSRLFSAKAEDRRRTERRNRRRRALKSGKVATQSRRIACQRLADYIRRVPTWQDILAVFEMQKGTFDGYCYATAFYRISQKPCPQMAMQDKRYSLLAEAAVAKMSEAESTSVEEFDASLLCLMISGVGLTANPGPTSVFGTAEPLLDDSAPAQIQSIDAQTLPKECNKLLEKSIELLHSRLATDKLRQLYWLHPHHLASLLYGMGHAFAGETSYAESDVSQEMSPLLPLIEQNMEKQTDYLGPFEVSRALTGVAMLELRQSETIVSLLLGRLREIHRNMHSIDWALTLWSLAVLQKEKMFSAATKAFLLEVRADIEDRIMIQRWNLRPEDLGIISWSLTELGIGNSDLMAALVNVANHESWRPYIVKQNRKALESSLRDSPLKAELKAVDSQEQESVTNSSSEWAAVGSLRVEH
eukprot:gb/GECG01007031.1/.p1 GENE.gb/GECG01007031.1/~~gb/GECG01007031.1/.p1  ORF type:complete len:461 (+),score=34.32 gb/GECG01007031.1/:1-1383(+)